MTAISTTYHKCSWIAFGLMCAFWVGRFVFTLGYAKLGPNARLPGALVMDLVILALVVLSIVSVAFAINQYSW